MAKYNIVFASDESYVKHTAVSLISLLEHNKEVCFEIYYIIDHISKKNKGKLTSITSKYDCELQFVIIDGKKFDSYVTNFHFNKAVYYRLMMANFINEKVVLYMDSDIVINGSIKDIFETNLGDNYLAAVENPRFHRHKELSMNHNSVYFNAGLLLINLEKWRQMNVLEQCVHYIEKNRRHIKFADQDVLNAVVDGEWISLHPKNNQQAVFFEHGFEEKHNCYTVVELKEAKENPVIIHYTGSSKPWSFKNKHPFKHLYWQYLKMTPFSRRYSEDLTILNLLKWIIPKSVKEFLKGELLKWS